MIADFTILSGTAHPALAQAVARELGVRPGACAVERFPDGEVSVRLPDPVRAREVVLLQPTPPPVDPHLMELLAMADACRRASAARVTAVVPYLGYARADKRDGVRGPITARVVADLLQAVGIGHVVLVDPHTPQIEGFFHAPREALELPALREVWVSDTIPPRPGPRLRVASVASLLADALRRFLGGPP